jgi:hypothetical protein
MLTDSQRRLMASASQATTASADASDDDVTDLTPRATSQPETDNARAKKTTPQQEKHNKLEATVRWVEDGQKREQPGLMFDLQYHAAYNTAFFKLRASVTTKSGATSEQVSLFMFLAPEAIQTLSLSNDHAQELGPDTICLRFGLTSGQTAVPVLVVPKTMYPSHVAWKNKQSHETWESLRLLTRATNLDILCRLPRRVMSEARLQSFCQALSGGQVTSTPGLADLGGLYGGKGGRVAQFDSEVGVEDTPFDESLPAYEDIEPGPPMPPVSPETLSNKRRRLNSDDGSQVIPVKPKGDLEATVAWLVTELKEHKAREALLVNELKEVHAKVAMLISQQEQHMATCTVLENEVHGRVSEMASRLDEVDEELETRVDCRVDEVLDEKSDIIKGELLDYIDETLPNRIQGALEEVTFSARF